jgi:hypothetical protein
MLIVNKLPQFVYLNNEKFCINIDYRKMVLFEIKMQDKKLTKEEKILIGLKLLYPAFSEIRSLYDINPTLLEEASNKLIWFYKCGRNFNESHKSKGGGSSKNIYSYEYDDEFIYSAFVECYGVDLNKTEMHWWKFKALMKGLNSKCEFVKIKGYRSYSGKDKELIKLRDYYKIPMTNDEKAKLKAIEKMLM